MVNDHLSLRIARCHMDSARFSFPAVKGIQASMEYYVAMVPLDCISKLFTFTDENLPPEIRSQRTLNKARIPEIREYILSNPKSYVFSALTASIDGDVDFEAVQENSNLGMLSISMAAKLLINDGQHRRAAIEEALKKNPELKYEHISIVLYHDIGLKRSQQMFSDLNRFAIRPTKSLNILYDNRDFMSLLVKHIIASVPNFNQLIDKEHTSIPNRSIALFTLSAMHHGTKALLKDFTISEEEQTEIAKQFWTEIYKNMTEWKMVADKKIKASEIRRDSLSPLSITIRSLGEIGNILISEYPQDWKMKLVTLKKIDWKKTNPLWQNGIVVNGSVQLSHATQAQMVTILRKIII